MATGGLILGNRENWWIAAGVIVVGLFIVVRSFRDSTLRGWPKWLAASSKLAALALISVLLLEPQMVSEIPRKGANDVALLADNSASLAISDPLTKIAPAAAVRAALGGSPLPAWQGNLQETFRTQRFTFDTRLREATDFSALDFKGAGSALVTSIDSLFRRYEKRPLAAVLVVTDGNVTDEAALQALLAKKAAAPVYLVAAGRDQPAPDLALGEVSVSQTPFEDSPVSVSTRVSISGLKNESLTLVIRDEAGKTVLTQKEHPAPEQPSHAFSVRFRPTAKGVSFYTATVLRSSAAALLDKPEQLAAASGEVTLDNNSRIFAVDRKTGPYRVLYVSGRPNWEYKFLRRALTADDELKLTALIRIAKREPKFQWRGRAGEESNPLFRGFGNQSPEEALRYDKPVLIPMGVMEKTELSGGFPATAEELFGTYRCVILDDVEAEFFTRSQLDLLERFVSVRGGSLLMLGGSECYQPGGWAHTPVARMLPVYLDGVAAGAPVEDARFKLTREGWLEPWIRLRSSEPEEEARQKGMASFYSVNPVGGIKPGASVLATVTDPKRGELPAWVTQRYGSGTAAAVTVGDLWRWALRNPESHADFDKAWRQLLRHLVVDVPDRTAIQVVSGATGRVKVEVRVRDSAFKPVEDAAVLLSLDAPGGAHSELAAEASTMEAGLFEAETSSGAAGAYRVKAMVKDADGKLIGEPATGWATNPLADETASLVNNRPLMERIAKWSGGRILSLDELPSLAKLLPKLTAPVTESHSEPLWHSPWLLVLLVALLGTEWWLRRRVA